MKLLFISLATLFCFWRPSFATPEIEELDSQICVAYLTGIGCPACAQIEPILLSKLTERIPQLTIIEYEIYQAREPNLEIVQKYFESFRSPETRMGIPSLILDGKTYVGANATRDALEKIKEKSPSYCPTPTGDLLSPKTLQVSQLPGRPRIWTKNRVFILESDDFTQAGGITRDTCLRNLIQAKNLEDILPKIPFEKIEPKPLNTSRGKIEFDKAILVGNWRMQWNEKLLSEKEKVIISVKDKTTAPFFLNWSLLLIAFGLGFLSCLLALRWKKINIILKNKKKNLLITFVAILLLVGFFIAALNVSSSFLSALGYRLPLPLFTFFIALVDGFNPCNMFVLTVLLTLLISSSASRKRFYLVGFIFILVVFLFYFLFMAAWLNIFKYLGFAGPLRIIIAIIALGAGLINCKEFFLFKKGPSLMIADKHKSTLYAKMRSLTGVINKGSLPLLVSSSVTLAVFSSLIEIPCTAGFPILYTSVLSAQVETGQIGYLFYLIFYNLIYVFPLLAIIAILGFTFQAKRISEKQIQIIKFIGGVIMIFLGIILLVNPGLIGAAI